MHHRGCSHLTKTTLLAFGGLASACVSAHRAPEPVTPKAAEIVQTAAPSPTSVAEAAPEAATVPAAEPEPPAPPAHVAIPIHKGTRVLMFGDSMVTSGLGATLEEHVLRQGGKFFRISKPSSTTLTWTEGRLLQDLVRSTRPDVVIVVLASNELFVPNPHARTQEVRTIIKRIGARPCVWIGPNPWRPEKGIIGVVRESSTPCRFFDSSALDLERGPDGIHPTMRGGKTWANAVWQDTFAE